MNAKLYSSLLIPLALAACTSTPQVPPETVIVKVPVSVPCVGEAPKKPLSCVPGDESRSEYMRCLLVNHSRLEAYKAELEAVLSACTEELK